MSFGGRFEKALYIHFERKGVEAEKVEKLVLKTEVGVVEVDVYVHDGRAYLIEVKAVAYGDDVVGDLFPGGILGEVRVEAVVSIVVEREGLGHQPLNLGIAQLGKVHGDALKRVGRRRISPLGVPLPLSLPKFLVTRTETKALTAVKTLPAAFRVLPASHVLMPTSRSPNASTTLDLT